MKFRLFSRGIEIPGSFQESYEATIGVTVVAYESEEGIRSRWAENVRNIRKESDGYYGETTLTNAFINVEDIEEFVKEHGSISLSPADKLSNGCLLLALDN